VESLKGQYIDTALSLNLSVDDLWESLDLCLSIRESAFCRLVAHGTAAEHGVVPDSMQIGGGSSRPIAATIGLCDGEKLALFVLGTDGIFIRSFGNGASLAKRLLRNIESWNESSRPRNSDLLVRAYPATGVNESQLAGDPKRISVTYNSVRSATRVAPRSRTRAAAVHGEATTSACSGAKCSICCSRAKRQKRLPNGWASPCARSNLESPKSSKWRTFRAAQNCVRGGRTCGRVFGCVKPVSAGGTLVAIEVEPGFRDENNLLFLVPRLMRRSS